MSDLISRGALLDEIDGIYKRHYVNSAYQFIHDFFRAIFRRINKAPAVDAVEVGSCDGCHWKEIGRQQKCSCCRRNRYLKDNYERRVGDGK